MNGFGRNCLAWEIFWRGQRTCWLDFGGDPVQDPLCRNLLQAAADRSLSRLRSFLVTFWILPNSLGDLMWIFVDIAFEADTSFIYCLHLCSCCFSHSDISMLSHSQIHMNDLIVVIIIVQIVQGYQ